MQPKSALSVSDRQVTKTSKSSCLYHILLSSCSVSQATTAITTWKNNIITKCCTHHLSFSKYVLEIFGDSQIIPCMLMLTAIWHYNIIHSSYAPEAQLSMCLDRYSPKVRWYNAKQCEGMYVCFQERYCKVYIVHENVDSTQEQKLLL